MVSSLKLVGDRHGLRERQRLAVSRCACSDQDMQYRKDHCVSVEQLRNQQVIVDGFNLIITIEAALSGGPLLIGVDDCIRDLSSVHGSYRSVEETDRAILMIGEALQRLAPSSVWWLLDRPVSNSGRLAAKIADLAKFFEIEHLLSRITMSLSTGQLTRVNLAKAFVNDPALSEDA